MTVKYVSNKQLLTTISAISAVLIARLAFAASESQNWRGFFYSALHVIVAATFAYVAVRNSVSQNSK